MHISEGVLSGQVLAAGAGLTACGLALGLRKLEESRIPEVAVLTSAFFVATLVRVPAGPASIHLTLNGLMGLALGWAAFPAIFVALTLQALLFQFGGFTSLGVNTLVMAAPAVIVHYALRPLILSGSAPNKGQGSSRTAIALGGFLAGTMGILLAASLMALALFATGEQFREIGGVILVTNLMAALIEGVVTAFMASFIMRVRPEIFFADTGRHIS